MPGFFISVHLQCQKITNPRVRLRALLNQHKLPFKDREKRCWKVQLEVELTLRGIIVLRHMQVINNLMPKFGMNKPIGIIKEHPAPGMNTQLLVAMEIGRRLTIRTRITMIVTTESQWLLKPMIVQYASK